MTKGLQAYLDQTQLMDPEPALALGEITLAPAGYLHDQLRTYDVDFQHRFSVGMQQQTI